MSAVEAYEFFKENRKLKKALGAMLEVGLPYLSLGQPLSTLSGGKRHRVKLAKDLYKKGNIYVLDEPNKEFLTVLFNAMYDELPTRKNKKKT